MTKATSISTSIISILVAAGLMTLMWSSGWLFSSWGQFGIYDYIYLGLMLTYAVGVATYAIVRFKLYFPPLKPFALVCFSYWLTAITFSGFYSLIYKFDPTSFTGSLHGSNWDFAYFSFVTITTLGYGEIQPVSFVARWLAIFEACIGLFYVAVLIAITLRGSSEFEPK